jgi:hypothetical protein
MWVGAGVARDAQAARDGRAVQHLVSVEDDATDESRRASGRSSPARR